MNVILIIKATRLMLVMTILALPAFKDNYIWIIVNESKHAFICIDPGDSSPVLEYARKNHLNLTHILITHHHQDHAGGIHALIHDFPDAIVYGPEDERLPNIHVVVHNEDLINIDHYTFRVLCTPGHTSSHLCYQEPSKNWLFCGDTLFSAGCGRVFDGSLHSLYNSLCLLKQLPSETQIFAAHEYTRDNLRFAMMVEPSNEDVFSYATYLNNHATKCSLPSRLSVEMKINPFLRTDLPALQHFAKKEGIDPSDSFELFKALRRMKDHFH